MRQILFIATIGFVLFSQNIRADETETIKLDKRTESRYRKSGYSFRYRTQQETKHKNYVDLVFEAGRMRINNHGGLKNRIADLGSIGGLKEASKIRKQDADWTEEMMLPKEGHTYAMEINENKTTMLLLFHVTKVTDENMHFEWQPVTKKTWPISLQYRAAAGTSGMMGGQATRSKYGKQGR